MTQIRRRPGAQPSGEGQVNLRTKAFNKDLRYVAGFRSPIAASSSTTIPINLPSSGQMFLGISVIPASGTNSDIADCQGTLSINNNNVLVDVPLANLNPNYVGNMVFFPVPQPLNGSDTIKFLVTKNNAGAITIIVNTFYVPKMS